MPTVLLTAFEPFGEFPVNPSETAVRAMAGRDLPGVRLITEVLPVEFARCVPRIVALMRDVHPDVALATGVADREVLTLERVAVNLIDARIPDNAGARPVDEPVVPGGPDAHLTTLPVKAMAAAVHAAGIPCELSLSAGTHACNAVMYAALHHAPPGTGVGFAHLPPLTRLGPEDAARALTAALVTALVTLGDPRAGAPS